MEQIEASGEFQAKRAADRERTDSVRRLSAQRRERAVAAAVKIEVPILHWQTLVERACRRYNARKSSRKPEASPRSEASFLHRICVNYLRHELTAYHGGVKALGGRAGDERDRTALRAKFLDAIAAAYPILRAACEQARTQRSQLVEAFIPNRPNAATGRRAVYRRYP